MRLLTASIVIGPLVMIGALPAVASQAIAYNPPVQLAAGNDSTTARDTYAQKARDEMQEWQQKLHGFREKAAAKGQQEGNAAENELYAAWAKAEVEAHKLQTASAKISFDKVSRELADAWDRIRPEDKGSR